MHTTISYILQYVLMVNMLKAGVMVLNGVSQTCDEPVCCVSYVSVSNSLQVGGSPVSVQLGHTATLPCWLSPPQSAEQLEVRWFLPGGGFDSPVLLYQRAHLEYGSQYAGRVSLGLKDATSSGLREGDVSLKLANATLQDARDYSCYVTSDKEYDTATVSLVVTGE